MVSPYCVFCGGTVDREDAVTCPKCALVACASCVAGGYNECPDCGAKMGEAASPTSATPANADQPSPTQAADKPAPAADQPGPQRHAAETKPDNTVKFPLHELDPDGWRRDTRLGEQAAGPTIVFVGVLLAMVVLIVGISISGALARRFVHQSHGYATHKPPPPRVATVNKRRVEVHADDLEGLLGKWEGRFGSDADVAELSVEKCTYDEFDGVLTLLTDRGTYRIAVHGYQKPGTRQVAFRETAVKQQPSGANWVLGRNDGKLSADRRSMFGTGTDGKNPSYEWSFERVGN